MARRCGTAVALLVQQASWMLGASKAVLPAPNQRPVLSPPSRMPLDLPAMKRGQHGSLTLLLCLSAVPSRMMACCTTSGVDAQQGAGLSGLVDTAGYDLPVHNPTAGRDSDERSRRRARPCGPHTQPRFSLSRHLAWEQAKPSQILDLPRPPVPRLRARGVCLLLAGPVGLESARVALQRASLAGERGGG